MYRIVVLALVVQLAAAVPAGGVVSDHPTFEAWKLEHGKEYNSIEAETAARLVFEENKNVVDALNRENLEHGVVFKLNHFADMTPETFAAKVLMPRREAPALPAHKELQIGGSIGDVPASFDWREHGAVTPVKDQGSVGSCWAFSTIGNIEGQWFLANKTLVNLSEEQIVECDSTQDPRNNNADCGVFGGWPYLAMEYVINAGGVESETSYPYCVGTGKCFPCMAPGYNKTRCGPPVEYCNQTQWYCHQTVSADAARISNWAFVPENETLIAAALYTHGPLSVAFDAMNMQFYHSGVWHGHMCSKQQLDHAVLIVGYGVDKTLFGKEEPYWIVKNSWSTKWGEQGYFRIARGDGTCGINTQVVTAVV